MDGSVRAVLAAYQNNLVSSKSDDVTIGSMPTILLQMSGKVHFGSERVSHTTLNRLPWQFLLFETEFGRLIRFNEKRATFETK